jgi:hypothetical protein
MKAIAEPSRDLTREEVLGRFDADARRYLHLSGAEFLRRVERGQRLPDHPMTGHLLARLGANLPRESRRRSPERA